MAKITLVDESGTPTTPAAGTTVIYTEGGIFKVLTSTGIPGIPIMPSLLTTNGDMIYRNGAGVVTRLGAGTAGQILWINAGLPEWHTLIPAEIGAVATFSYSATGDILYRNQAGVILALPIGAPGQVLMATSVGPDTLPAWMTQATMPPTAYTIELQIINGRSSIVVGEADAGGHPFNPTRYSVSGTTTVLTLEVHAYITNAATTGRFRLYDGGGVLLATLDWTGAPGVVGSTQTAAVALPGVATNYTATMDVVGGDGILDTMHIDSAALVVTHT